MRPPEESVRQDILGPGYVGSHQVDSPLSAQGCMCQWLRVRWWFSSDAPVSSTRYNCLVMTYTYLAGGVNSDQLGGSPRVRAFHCTWVGLTLGITPNVVDSTVQFMHIIQVFALTQHHILLQHTYNFHKKDNKFIHIYTSLVILFVKKGYGLVSARSQPYRTWSQTPGIFYKEGNKVIIN